MALRTGQVSITGTAQQLTTTAYESDQFVVKAPSGNAAAVYLGPAGVTTATGHLLEAGEDFKFSNEQRSGEVSYDLDPHELYVVGTAGTDKVTWVAWVR